MPKTDEDFFGPVFERGLRQELNRIRPRNSSPRYLAPAHQHLRTWRFAPVALAVSLVSILALSASVATGSPNPVVWTQRVVTVIESNPAPTPEPGPVQPKVAPRAGSTQGPQHQAPATSKPPERSETPEPARTADPRESPEPSDHQSGSRESADSSHTWSPPVDDRTWTSDSGPSPRY